MRRAKRRERRCARCHGVFARRVPSARLRTVAAGRRSASGLRDGVVAGRPARGEWVSAMGAPARCGGGCGDQEKPGHPCRPCPSGAFGATPQRGWLRRTRVGWNPRCGVAAKPEPGRPAGELALPTPQRGWLRWTRVGWNPRCGVAAKPEPGRPAGEPALPTPQRGWLRRTRVGWNPRCGVAAKPEPGRPAGELAQCVCSAWR